MGNVKGSQITSLGEASLSKSALDLDNCNYQLALEEVAYDEKCLEVYLSKLSNFEVRVKQLKEQWNRKRQDGAKEAIHSWMDQYVAGPKNH
jgi:hypothetical protein